MAVYSLAAELLTLDEDTAARDELASELLLLAIELNIELLLTAGALLITA